jgi:predicted transglutaminase-like cysteine proteinase
MALFAVALGVVLTIAMPRPEPRGNAPVQRGAAEVGSAHAASQANPAARVQLAALDPTGTTIAPRNRIPASPRGEPFERFAVPAVDGLLWRKWQEAEASIAAEALALNECWRAPASCAPAARTLANIIDAAREKRGRARIGAVNRAVNLAIRPVSDRAQFGAPDVWTSPFTTLASGRGDCEDYAIAKYLALREAGLAAEDLRLVIVRDSMAKEDHAVLAARVDERWLILDNRHHILVDSAHLPHFTPLFAIDHEGVRRFTPVLAGHQTIAAEPAPAHTDAPPQRPTAQPQHTVQVR